MPQGQARPRYQHFCAPRLVKEERGAQSFGAVQSMEVEGVRHRRRWRSPSQRRGVGARTGPLPVLHLRAGDVNRGRYRVRVGKAARRERSCRETGPAPGRAFLRTSVWSGETSPKGVCTRAPGARPQGHRGGVARDDQVRPRFLYLLAFSGRSAVKNAERKLSARPTLVQVCPGHRGRAAESSQRDTARSDPPPVRHFRVRRV
jgi:hypothetical protein